MIVQYKPVQWNVNYDFETNEILRHKMLNEHIPGNLKFCGTLEEFKRRLLVQKASLETDIDQRVKKWWSLECQINYLEKLMKGEFVYGPENEKNQTDLASDPAGNG